jgi:hypothetical protein
MACALPAWVAASTLLTRVEADEKEKVNEKNE